jgi:DNA-binding NarL/FixJ family response regulator
MNGIELVPRLKHLEVPCRILMFTMHESAWLADEIKQAGAEGYLLKSQASKDLVGAIETLLHGGKFFAIAARESSIEGAGKKYR